MLHKCNVWQTQRAMKSMFCTQPAPFPQVGRAPRCRCRRLSAPDKLANCFNMCLQLRKLRHKTVKSLVPFPWGLSSKARHPKFHCQFQLGVTLHNPWLHGCCHTLPAKPWGPSPGISWEQRRRMFWMGSGDGAAHHSLGKCPQSWCTATV